MAFNYKIFLASRSPRRRELVKEIFNNVEALDLSGDEPRWAIKQTPEGYLGTCLDFKWNLAAAEFSRKMHLEKAPCGLLVADTIVVLGKKVLGKPDDKRTAEAMLRELSGRKHTVLTGLRLGYQKSPGAGVRTEERVVKTEVEFHKLTPAEIRAYVKTGSPMDKAGAYGFQDEALRFVARIKGSYLNVVGLPVLELNSAAEALGWT